MLAALRARFFLHIWREFIKEMADEFPDLYRPARSFISAASFNIFNRLCDSLVMLALAYARFYPDQPFCPWMLGTAFVEHFFGLARSLLPDFTYAEFLKLVKHVMLRQHILLSGKVNPKKERTSRAGYILDYDTSSLSAAELENLRVRMPDDLLNQTVELAYLEATQIATQLLYLPRCDLPISLTPLRPPNTSSLDRGKERSEEDNADSEDDNDEAGEEDSETADEPEEGRPG